MIITRRISSAGEKEDENGDIGDGMISYLRDISAARPSVRPAPTSFTEIGKAQNGRGKKGKRRQQILLSFSTHAPMQGIQQYLRYFFCMLPFVYKTTNIQDISHQAFVRLYSQRIPDSPPSSLVGAKALGGDSALRLLTKGPVRRAEGGREKSGLFRRTGKMREGEGGGKSRSELVRLPSLFPSSSCHDRASLLPGPFRPSATPLTSVLVYPPSLPSSGIFQRGRRRRRRRRRRAESIYPVRAHCTPKTVWR